MSNKIKTIASFWINGIILKIFGLKLSYRQDVLLDMKKLLSKFEVKHIVDGGACYGSFSLDILPIFINANIYAFEPQSAPYAVLQQLAASNSRIRAFPYALGESSEKIKLYTNTSPFTASLSPSSQEGLNYFGADSQPKGVEIVELITLHSFLSKEGLPHIDILKLDLQGYEIKALYGLADSIENVKLIYTEVQFVKTYQTCCLFSDIDQFLQQNGFLLYQFYSLVTSPKDGRLLYGDAIFINSRHISLA